MLIGAVLIFSSVQLEPPEEYVHAAYHERWFTEAILKLTRLADRVSQAEEAHNANVTYCVG